MAILFTSGFETGDFSEWTSVDLGAPSVQSTIKQAGSFAMRANPATSQHRVLKEYTGATTLYVQGYFRRASTDVGQSPILFDIWASSLLTGVWIQHDGANFRCRNPDNTATALGPASVIDTWHKIDLTINATANPWNVSWKIDDVAQTNIQPANAAATIDRWWIGTWGYDMVWEGYFDSLTLADSPISESSPSDDPPIGKLGRGAGW